MPQFNPLNGAELKKIILSEIDKELGKWPEFRVAISHLRPEWTFELKLVTKPELEGKPLIVKVAGEHKNTPEPTAEHKQVQVTRKGSSGSLDYPDKAREDAGLELPGIQSVDSDGQLADFAVGQGLPGT